MNRSNKIAGMNFSKVYPLLQQKVEKKGRTKAELDEVIHWLTGYDDEGLAKQLEREVDYQTLFAEAPRMNPLANLITGVICGYRVEEIEDPIVQQARWLDKLVDELAKGRPMEKILRTEGSK